MQTREIKKILIFCLDNKIGDTVIESLLFREVKKIMPQAEVTLIMYKPFDFFIKNNPNISDIIALSGKEHRWLAAFKAIAEVRKGKYDLLITCGQSIKRRLYYKLLGIKNIALIKPAGFRHKRYVYIELLKKLGAQAVNDAYDIFIDKSNEAFAAKFIKDNNMADKKIIIVNPKGAAPERTISALKMQQLLSSMKKYEKEGFCMVLLDYQNSYDNCGKNVFLYKSNNILEVCALVKAASFVLTVDTGIVHIADTYGKKMLVLYHNSQGKLKVNQNRIVFGSRTSENCFIQSKGSVEDIENTEILNKLDEILLRTP